MTKMNTILRTAGAAGALFALAGSALADGYGGSIKDAPPAEEGRKFSYSVTFGGTTDYIFRGTSLSSNNPAAQGSIDLSYGIFYAGAWATNLDDGGADPNFNDGFGNLEVDVYAGIKPVLGPVTFDLGIIGYLYPGDNYLGKGEAEYFELKAGASIAPFANATLGVTTYYTPELSFDGDEAFAVEGAAGYTFAAIGRFTPSISGGVGYQWADKGNFGSATSVSLDDDYVYWNAGVSVAVDKFTFDVRYWDTDIASTNALSSTADERVVGTLKVTLP